MVKYKAYSYTLLHSLDITWLPENLHSYVSMKHMSTSID